VWFGWYAKSARKTWRIKLRGNNQVKVAIFGSTSNIAADVIKYFLNKNIDMDLYSRNKNTAERMTPKIDGGKINYLHYSVFNATVAYDVIINFIGLGCPKKINKAADELVSVAAYYDTMILNYLSANSRCKYIFISSGVVYGEDFLEPIPCDGKAVKDNFLEFGLSSYAISKITCEKRHRNFQNLSIVDLRVFSYFNSSYDPSSQFFMSQICNAIRDDEVLTVSADKMVRDYIHPFDFCALIDAIIKSQPMNTVLDCYSREPIEKMTLLEAMKKQFGLKYFVKNQSSNQTIYTNKMNYYSQLSSAKKIGYTPNYSSLEGLIYECKKLFPVISDK
jgi:nucleoside-diphosphate-sugar epimerase